MTPAARAVLAALALALGAGSVAHLWTGLADQGDYARSTGFLLERPEAFPAEVRAARADERRDRYLSAWHDRWVIRAAPDWGAIFNASTYKLVLAAQVAFDAALTRDRVHSLRLGSVPERVLLVLALLALARAALRKAPLAAALPFAALLAATGLEGSFVAFLNSAYEDQVAIVALPALAALVWREASAPTRFGAVGAVALAALAGGAKAQFFALPLLAAPFLWPALRARFRRGRAAALVVAAQLAALGPVVLNPASGVNAYHAAYAGLLRMVAPEARADVRLGGSPVLQECVGVKGFGARGRACVEEARVGFADVARLALERPRALAAVFGRIVWAGTDLELAYLGRAMPGAPTFTDLPPLAIWRAVFRVAGLAVFPAALLATALLLRRARRGGPGVGPARAGAFLGLFGASQYVVALADGLVEVPKHVLVGNYANVLCVSFGALALAWALADRRESSRADRAQLTAAADSRPG